MLQWIDDTRELLRKLSNYIAAQEAGKPTTTGKALTEEIERLMVGT